MKKLFFLTVLFFYGFNLFVIGQVSVVRNNIGFGIAYIPSFIEGIYFDDPWNFWPNREPSNMLQANYSRQLNQSFRSGLYLEYEKVRFSVLQNDSVRSFRRYNLGVDWVGQFPSTPLHLQLGGYMGFGFLMANHWDRLTGFDLGLIAGPAYEQKQFGVSAQLRSGFAPYSSSGIPLGVLLFNPKLMLKIYFRF